MKFFVSFVWPLTIIAFVVVVLAAHADARCRHPLKRLKAVAKFVLPGR